jgi:hypothetical protein
MKQGRSFAGHGELALEHLAGGENEILAAEH